MRPVLALALLAGWATAAPVPKSLKKVDDATLLLGTWKQVENGREWFRFDADGTVNTWVTESPGSPVTFTYAIVADAKPPHMTWTSKGSTTPTYRCLFEIDGDTLRLNYTQAGRLPESVADTFGHPIRMTRDTSAK